MTKASYERYAEEYLTGPGTETCLTGALDGTMSRVAFNSGVYKEYEEYVNSGEESSAVFLQWMRSLQHYYSGSACEKNMSARLARTAEALAGFLRAAREGGRKVILFTEENHVIGLSPSSEAIDLWECVDTLQEFPGDETFDAEAIFPYLAQPRGKRQQGNKYNVVFMAPEPRKGRRNRSKRR